MVGRSLSVLTVVIGICASIVIFGGRGTASAQTDAGQSTKQLAQLGSGSRGQSAKQNEPFERRLWKYLESSRYQNWSPAGDDGDFQESEAPHGALVKTFMNRTAAGHPETLPNGSILIKENYSPDKKLMAITLMYRSKGYNPSAGDWYWVKYDSKGNVAQMQTPQGKMAIAGKAKGCIECHSGTDGGDFAFFND